MTTENNDNSSENDPAQKERGGDGSERFFPPVRGGQGRGGCRRRGRQRCRRKIRKIPNIRFFKPAGLPLSESTIISLSYSELEAIRLVDLVGLTQEEAAERMGISRRTFWKDIKNARRKVATALTEGQAIRITGENFLISDDEPDDE